MALHDYSEEDDYYTQDFGKRGVVSVWAGLSEAKDNLGEDVLQDLCGVGYYSLDNQEANCFDFELVRIEKLLADLSYASSFVDSVKERAHTLGIEMARWIVLQYDFAYAPERTKRQISPDPIFLGVFPYAKENAQDV